MNHHDKSWEITRGEANQRNQRKVGVLRLLRIRAFYRLKINVKNAIMMKRTTLQNVEWDALTMAPKDEPSHGNEMPTASLCKSQWRRNIITWSLRQAKVFTFTTGPVESGLLQFGEWKFRYLQSQVEICHGVLLLVLVPWRGIRDIYNRQLEGRWLKIPLFLAM